MIGKRAKILPNESFLRLGGDLEEYLESWVKQRAPLELVSLFDPAVISILHGAFFEAGGSEGTIWLVDGEGQNLVAVENSGKDSAELVGFQQPIGSGIISMVYAQQQPYCENAIESSSGHDDTLDRKIAKHTAAMIAVPLYFAFGLRGVVSCVQLAESDSATERHGFRSGDVETLARAVNVAERLVNETMLLSALGLSDAG